MAFQAGRVPVGEVGLGVPGDYRRTTVSPLRGYLGVFRYYFYNYVTPSGFLGIVGALNPGLAPGAIIVQPFSSFAEATEDNVGLGVCLYLRALPLFVLRSGMSLSDCPSTGSGDQ